MYDIFAINNSLLLRLAVINSKSFRSLFISIVYGYTYLIHAFSKEIRHSGLIRIINILVLWL